MNRNPGSRHDRGLDAHRRDQQNASYGTIARIAKAVVSAVKAMLPGVFADAVRGMMAEPNRVEPLVIERFKHGGLEFVMATGSLDEIETLIESLPNKRNILSVGIDEFSVPNKARIAYLQGNLERVAAGQIEDAPKRLFNERVFVGTFEWFRKFTVLDGCRLVVLGGPGLAKPFIQNFAMRCAHAMFEDDRIIGAETDANTNYLIAPSNTTRMIGTWLRKAPDTFVAQVVTNKEMITRHSTIGTIGLMQIVTETGEIFVHATRQLALGIDDDVIAWTRVTAQLPVAVEDISTAFKQPDGSYRVIATMQEDNEHTYIPLDIRHKDGKIEVTVNMKEAIKRGTRDEYLGGFITVVGNSATFVDANGGPNMISLRGLDQIPALARIVRTSEPVTRQTTPPIARA